MGHVVVVIPASHRSHGRIIGLLILIVNGRRSLVVAIISVLEAVIASSEGVLLLLV